MTHPHIHSLFIEDLEELFTDAQLQGVFQDQKTFPDCSPKAPVKEILQQYRIVKQQVGFDLKAFVFQYFDLPKNEATTYKSNTSLSLEHHINALWDVLRRTAVDNHSSLIPLPQPFIVPGGRFRECFYWDSYFTMLGLQVAQRTDMIEHMIDNFAFLIDQFGFIPNGNRTYFLSRSQPPFFSLMVELLSKDHGQSAYVKYLPQLHKEYNFWMDGEERITAQQSSHAHLVKMPHGEFMNRYYDKQNTPRPESFLEDTETSTGSDQDICLNIRAACESGWDFSSRWFKDQQNLNTAMTTDIVPIDLNCLLWHLEQTIEIAEEITGNDTKAKLFREKASSRKDAIRKYLWSDAKQTYFDYQRSAERQTESHSIAIAYPLFMGLSNNKEAAAVAWNIEQNFLKSGGLLTTLNHSGQQWDAPNGWAPLQWIAFKGLKDYGHHALAEKIKTNWMSNIEKHFLETGKVSEKYNVEDTDLIAEGGEYPNQDGFGWTNGVYLKMKNSE